MTPANPFSSAIALMASGNVGIDGEYNRRRFPRAVFLSRPASVASLRTRVSSDAQLAVWADDRSVANPGRGLGGRVRARRVVSGGRVRRRSVAAAGVHRAVRAANSGADADVDAG